MEIKSTKQVIADFGLKILVHGPPGAGKTRLCATTGDLERTLIISAEGGLLSIKDWEIDVVQVTSIGEVYEVYEYLKKAEHDYQWVCLDSISEIAEVVLQGEKLRSRDARRAYGEMADTVFDLLRGFRNLPYHVVMTAKQGREGVDNRMLYTPMLPGRQLTMNIAYLFDEVFALRVEQNTEGELKRVLQTGKSRSYEAKDRSGRLAMYEEPDLALIHNKIKGLGENEEEEQEDEIIQTSEINGKQRIAASSSQGKRTGADMPTDEKGDARKRVSTTADDLRREYLRRRLYMLLKEAKLGKELILDYMAARCERDASGVEVSEVKVDVLENWARELEELEDAGARSAHVEQMVERWKAWKKKRDEEAA